MVIAHFIQISTWHILHDGVEFCDLGADYYNQFNREKMSNSLMKRLSNLGFSTPVEGCILLFNQWLEYFFLYCHQVVTVGKNS